MLLSSFSILFTAGKPAAASGGLSCFLKRQRDRALPSKKPAGLLLGSSAGWPFQGRIAPRKRASSAGACRLRATGFLRAFKKQWDEEAVITVSPVAASVIT